MPKKRKHGIEQELAEILHSHTPSTKVLYFIGIGGSSMHTLAKLSHSMGFIVRGSDRSESERTRMLQKQGIGVYIGQERSHVEGADLVIYTHAISDKNPEYLGAMALGIPMLSRAEFLGYIMRDYKSRIGVSGTHGKSTTVAMLDAIFTRATCDPTTLSGAELWDGESMRIGKGELLIYESCEYRDSFLSFIPTVAVALNLELDHTDYFPDITALRHSFARDLSHATSFAIVNYDDEQLLEIIPKLKCNTITFGQGERADWRYIISAFLSEGMEFIAQGV